MPGLIFTTSIACVLVSVVAVSYLHVGRTLAFTFSRSGLRRTVRARLELPERARPAQPASGYG